jgi:hypothetical protein
VIGRTDERQNPCWPVVYIEDAAHLFGCLSRNLSRPAVVIPRKQAGHTTAFEPPSIFARSYLNSRGRPRMELEGRTRCDQDRSSRRIAILSLPFTRSEKLTRSEKRRLRFRCARGRLVAERRDRGYTRYDEASGAPVARLRATKRNHNFEVLFWSSWRERWASTGPFGRTIPADRPGTRVHRPRRPVLGPLLIPSPSKMRKVEIRSPSLNDVEAVEAEQKPRYPTMQDREQRR